MFDNVIVGTDGPPAGRDPLALAQQLTSPDGQLTLAYVEVVAPRPGPAAGRVAAAAHAQRALRRLAQLRDESQIDAHVVYVEARSVAAGLHELAVRRAADLLVIGASSQDELLRPYGGDETRALLENAPCKVAVTPIGYATRPSRLTRIGAAYDGSPESERAVAVARALARERGAGLSAFEAVGEPAYVRSIVNPQPEIDEGLAEARRRISELRDVEPYAASSDDASNALARYGASVDLLVLGSHDYRPIDHLLSGSTAQQLADVTPCPLLVLSRNDPTAKEDPVADEEVLWAAVYDDVNTALADLAAFEELHEAEVVGKYDAAVIEKEDGRGKIVKRVDRPRARVIAETLGSGNLPGGQLEEAAKYLGSGEAGLIVVGERTLDKGFETAVTRAAKVVKRDFNATTDKLAGGLTEAFKE